MFAVSSYSQDDNTLFAHLEHPPEMDSTALNIFNKIVADTTVENHFFVTVNPLQSVAVEQAIPIRLPSHLDTIVNFTHNWLDYQADSNYVWHGYLYEKDSFYIHSGRGTLISEGGKKYGSFRIDSIYYDLVDLGGNANILVQYKYEDFTLDCGVPELDTSPPAEEPDSSLVAELRGSGPCPINVLILFSAEAKDIVGDIQQTAHISFEQLLNAIQNSGITSADFNLNLVGIEKLPGFHECEIVQGELIDGKCETDKEMTDVEIANLYLGYYNEQITDPNSNISNIREAFEADLVILLSRLSTYVPGFSGFARVGPDEALPYSIIDARRSNRNFTFSHEVGHLFGCLHGECSASWSAAEPYCEEEKIQARHPHRWKTRKFFGNSRPRYTIMRGISSGHTRAHFSNPDVKSSGGKKTGTDWRNNASWLKDMGCIISNWRENEIPPLFSHITAPTEACPCAHVNFHGHAEGGTWESYHYTWSYSYDGLNYIDYPFNGNFAHIQMPCPATIPPLEGHGLYVRLEVTDSGNNSHTTVFFVELEEVDGPQSPYIIPEQRDYISESTESDLLEFKVAPNPVTNVTNIEIENSSEKDISLTKQLFNTSGHLLLSGQMVAKKGGNNYSLNMTSYPGGMYFLRFSSDNTEKGKEVVTIKIIKQ